MEEVWEPIREFPDYEVSNLARVIFTRRQMILPVSSNQTGALFVRIYIDGYQRSRSLGKLVAEHFLEPVAEDRKDYYDTVMHLDGDLSNCRADNLHWAPRWYAIKFHKQQRQPPLEMKYKFYEVSDPDYLFADLWEPCARFGLLQYEIQKSLITDEPTWPYGLIFRFVKE